MLGTLVFISIAYPASLPESRSRASPYCGAIQRPVWSGRMETSSALAEQWGSEQQHHTAKPHTSPRAQMLTKYNWLEQNAVSGDVGHESDRTHLLGYLNLGKGGRIN